MCACVLKESGDLAYRQKASPGEFKIVSGGLGRTVGKRYIVKTIIDRAASHAWHKSSSTSWGNKRDGNGWREGSVPLRQLQQGPRAVAKSSTSSPKSESESDKHSMSL